MFTSGDPHGGVVFALLALSEDETKKSCVNFRRVFMTKLEATDRKKNVATEAVRVHI